MLVQLPSMTPRRFLSKHLHLEAVIQEVAIIVAAIVAVDSTQVVEVIIPAEEAIIQVEVITLVADTNFNIESFKVGVLQGTPIFCQKINNKIKRILY